MQAKPLRSHCLRTAIHDIGSRLTTLAQTPPESPALASRQEIYDLINAQASRFSADVLHENPVLVRTQILRLAAACAFALASIDQGEINW